MPSIVPVGLAPGDSTDSDTKKEHDCITQNPFEPIEQTLGIRSMAVHRSILKRDHCAIGRTRQYYNLHDSFA